MSVNQVLLRIGAFLGLFCPDFYSDIEDFTQISCRYLPKKLAAKTSESDTWANSDNLSQVWVFSEESQAKMYKKKSYLLPIGSWWQLWTALDLNDGQFLIAMRCRCIFYTNDAMSMFLAISYHRNRCDCFWSTIRTDCFPMVFPI